MSNSLAAVHPELIVEWSDKNEKKPTEVMAFANSKAWWKCRTCGYEWNTLMLISAVHHENGEEKLHLLMVDPHIPAGAKLY